jgi:hypothetical protein
MDFPMNGELLNLINHTAQKVAAETVAEIKRQNLMKEGRQTPFQKTETLLYNYEGFKAAIKDKEDQIEEIKEIGIRKKSTSISSFSGAAGYVDAKSEIEKCEEKIEELEHSIQNTKGFIRVIDDALELLKDDPFYDLIPMRYFEGYSREDIADHFYCDVKTITRNKNRLINILQIRMFSDEVISDIFGT